MKEDISILIIDDDWTYLTLLKDLVSDEGYTCTTASTVAQAIDILGTQSIKLAIIDLRLGGSGGLSIVEWIASNRISTNVIVYSAYPAIMTEQIVSRYGIEVAYWSKGKFGGLSDLFVLIQEAIR